MPQRIRTIRIVVASLFLSITAAGAEPSRNGSVPTVAATIPPPPAPNAAPSPLDGPILTDVPTWSETIRAVLLTAVPHQYEDKSRWGKTNEMFDGFRVRQRGFDIRVDERKKRVNNGAWQRFKVELINPRQNLKLLIGDFKPNGLNRYRFDVLLSSQMRCRGDFEHWMMGVKGLNVTVESEAEVEIRASCQLALRTEFTGKSFIPDLILEPRVSNVSLRLTDLEVRRIGEIRGDLAEGIGASSRTSFEPKKGESSKKPTKRSTRNEINFACRSADSGSKPSE